jgi:hypothetical protein
VWKILDKKDKDIVKLSKLCQHWAEHNDSHKESFLKWRDVAKTKGLSSVVGKLDSAIEMMVKCSEYLLSVHKELEQNN